MRKIYQHEWFGIKFADFCKMDSKNIADEEFYKKFYKKFYETFNNYDELPTEYKDKKINIAKDILLFANDYDELLSIGCGNGIVENFIVKNSDKKVVALEPSENSIWLNGGGCEVLTGFFPDVIKNRPKYKFGYCGTIDYVFDDTQYANFLKSIYDYKFDEFCLVEVITPKEGFCIKIKDFFKDILSNFGLYNRGQFWGYLRNIDEHVCFLDKAGFKYIEYGKHKHGSYWIRVRNEKN